MLPIPAQQLDWSVLRYGLANRTQLNDPVDKDAVVAFAETSLAALSSGDAGFEEIASLALDCPDSLDEMERAVWAISEILGGHDETRAARKWRAAELDALLPGPWVYPFYAVLEVSWFWERWGKELPGPRWTAEIYISNATGDYQEYLDEVLDQCRVWLQGEMLELGSPAPA